MALVDREDSVIVFGIFPLRLGSFFINGAYIIG